LFPRSQSPASGFEARIGIGGVAQAMADMSGPDAPVRTVVDPRKL
jgi:hypothetical protein